ncbi:MAG: S8 family serine peptidase, partial [Thermoleophilaceae bacterium]
MLAGLTGAALAPAQSSAPSTGRHLLLVPATPEGEAALAESDARVVAGYDEFTLVEASGADDAELRDAGAARRDDMRRVSLAGGSVDPARRQSLASKQVEPGAEELVLVQFVGPVKDAWRRRLERTGVEVIGYAAQNGYLVHARGRAVDRVVGLLGSDPSVRAVTQVEAGDKLQDVSGGGTFAVQTVAGERGADARSDARGLGASLQRASEVVGVTTQFLRLSRDEAERLAADPAVLVVEPYAEPRLLDERASQIAAANLSAGVPTGPGYLAWLTAEGFGASTFEEFTIDVTDEGLDGGSASDPDHADFWVDGVKPGSDRVDYATNYTGDSNARDCGGHGTNVASIAAGFNNQPDTSSGYNDSAGYNHGLGVAPRASVGASKIFDCAGGFELGSATFTSLTSAAYANDARISNNSWGFTGDSGPLQPFEVLGDYSAVSREYDALVRDAQPSVPGNQEMVEVFSAGNEGEGVSGS